MCDDIICMELCTVQDACVVNFVIGANGVTRLDGLVGDNVGLMTALMKRLNALIEYMNLLS